MTEQRATAGLGSVPRGEPIAFDTGGFLSPTYFGGVGPGSPVAADPWRDFPATDHELSMIEVMPQGMIGALLAKRMATEIRRLRAEVAEETRACLAIAEQDYDESDYTNQGIIIDRIRARLPNSPPTGELPAT